MFVSWKTHYGEEFDVDNLIYLMFGNDCCKRYYFGEDMDNYDKDEEQLIRKYLREVFPVDVSW